VHPVIVAMSALGLGNGHMGLQRPLFGRPESDPIRMNESAHPHPVRAEFRFAALFKTER
jgi:hypothetical protein